MTNLHDHYFNIKTIQIKTYWLWIWTLLIALGTSLLLGEPNAKQIENTQKEHLQKLLQSAPEQHLNIYRKQDGSPRYYEWK